MTFCYLNPHCHSGLLVSFHYTNLGLWNTMEYLTYCLRALRHYPGTSQSWRHPLLGLFHLPFPTWPRPFSEPPLPRTDQQLTP